MTPARVPIQNSAKFYLERKGGIPTFRGPGPIIDLAANLVNSVPLSPPFPKPPLQSGLPGYEPPGDPSPTQVWQSQDIS